MAGVTLVTPTSRPIPAGPSQTRLLGWPWTPLTPPTHLDFGLLAKQAPFPREFGLRDEKREGETPMPDPGPDLPCLLQCRQAPTLPHPHPSTLLPLPAAIITS